MYGLMTKSRLVGGSLIATALLFPCLTAGCSQSGHTDHGKNTAPVTERKAPEQSLAAIKAERAKLAAEDLKLVEAQQYCPVMDRQHLGSMGAPVKVPLKDQSVFLCCAECTKKAEADPDGTLAKVKDLKTVQLERAKLSAEERKLVDAQDFCAVQDGSRLGSMGAPYKLTIKGQTVYLCCDHCKKAAEANAEKTLARVRELTAQAPR